jgi:hypothetical protein
MHARLRLKKKITPLETYFECTVCFRYHFPRAAVAVILVNSMLMLKSTFLSYLLWINSWSERTESLLLSCLLIPRILRYDLVFFPRELHRDPNVLFVGYKVPHPLEHKVILKIQTTSNSTPVTALNSALNNLKTEIARLRERVDVRILSLHVPVQAAFSTPFNPSLPVQTNVCSRVILC